MDRWRRASLVVAALAVVAAVAASVVHAWAPAGEGPLDAGSFVGEGRECLPSSRHGSVTMGGEILQIRTRDTIVIDRVRLVDAVGLTLITAVLVPIGTNAVGYAEYPPPQDFVSEPGVQWAARRSAVGAVVTPDEAPDAPDARTATNLVTGIRVTGDHSHSFTAIAVDYHVLGGRSYSTLTSTSLTVAVAPATCF